MTSQTRIIGSMGIVIQSILWASYPIGAQWAWSALICWTTMFAFYQIAMAVKRDEALHASRFRCAYLTEDEARVINAMRKNENVKNVSLIFDLLEPSS